MENALYLNFNSNTALTVMCTGKAVQFVRFESGQVVLEKWPRDKFHKEYYRQDINRCPIDAAKKYLTTSKEFKISVSDNIKLLLLNMIKGETQITRKFNVLKENNPHRKGDRHDQYELLLECSSTEMFFSLGGKARYVEMWKEMGYINVGR